MTQNWRSLFTFSLLSLAFSIPNLEAKAQIIPDNTLGNENSVVNRINSLMERIDGGAIRGNNLFHSFLEFSIKEGHSAYFSNPEAIQTIFSRVTGNNPSLLFGTLGVLGNANLFFINPNGIIFGPNGSLDIRGSFVASTANSITFPDGNKFSATNPQGVPLLTINVPLTIGIQFEGDSSGTIINRGDLAAGNNLSLIGGTIVNTGKLSALNGAVNLKTVAGGTEVKLDETGNILSQLIQPLSQESNPLALVKFVTEVGENSGLTVNSLGKVTVTGTKIAVNPGDIIIHGGGDKVSLQAQSANLSAVNNLTLVNSLIGTRDNLILQANDTLKIRDSVENPFIAVAGGVLKIQGNKQVDIFALSHPDSGLVSGKDMILRSGNQVIGDAHYWSGGSFRVEKLDGSLGDLTSPNDPIIRSQGDINFFGYQGASLHILAGGAVNINTVIITGTDRISDTINPTATPTLSNVTLSDGSSLVIDGNAKPTLDIRAGMKRDAIGNPLGTSGNSSSDIFFNSFLSRVSPPTNNPVATSANITIGDIIIDPPNGVVYITNQFQPNSSLSGNIAINGNGIADLLFPNNFVKGIDARGLGGRGSDVILDARNNISLRSLINTTSDSDSSGDVTLLAKADIFLSTPASVNVRSGGGGNININAQNLFLARGTSLKAGISEELGSSEAQAGNIIINATGEIKLDRLSSIGNIAEKNTKGNAGDINITTQKLLVQNGGSIKTETNADGQAGNINIAAIDSVQIIGTSPDGQNFSNLSTASLGQGKAGNLTIKTRQLLVEDGGTIATSTLGKGSAGNLTITANDLVKVLGGNLNTSSEGSGDAGNLIIQTGQFIVENGGFISTLTRGEGAAGNLTINANDSVQIFGSSSNDQVESQLITLSTGKGKAGDLTIQTGQLIVRDGGFISTSTTGEGRGGNLTINALDLVQVIGNSSNNLQRSFLTTASDGKGKAGDLIIKTRQLLVQEGGLIFTSTLEEGAGGNLTILANDSIQLIGTTSDGRLGSRLQTSSRVKGKAGDLTIYTGQLLVQDGGFITTSTTGEGQAGSLTINASESVQVIGARENGLRSSITTLTLGEGNSGDLIVNTPTLQVKDGARVSAETRSSGNAGEIIIYAPDSITVTNGSQIRNNVRENATGNSQLISLNTPTLTLTDNSLISAATAGKGNAGDIIVNAPIAVNIGNNSQLTVETSGAGKPGNIDITTNTLTIGKDAQLSATTTATATNRETGGSINLNANQINLSGKLGIFAETQSLAPAGNLTLNPNNTPNLNINFTDNGFISARTVASGQGGNIDINAPQNLNIGGQGKITVETESSGNAGNINLRSQTLNLGDGLEISASTIGKGSAGNINLNAKQINLQQTTVNAFTNNLGNAGSISLSYQGKNANTVSLDNSQISTEIQKNGQANHPSNIDIKTDNLTLNNSTINASTQGKGNAGSITVPNAQNITLNQSEITASTSGEGNTGVIELNANNKLQLTNSQINSSVEQNALGNSLQITLNTPKITLNNRSQIAAATAGKGNAGNINVPNANIVNLDNSTISTAIAPTGITTQPSNITLNTQQLNLNNNSQITASTSGEGNAGDINLKTETLTLDNRSQIASAANLGASGDGGDINIKTATLSLNNASQITTSTEGKPSADAGKIELEANQITLDNNSQIAATTSGGKGGSIEVTANILNLTNGSQIRTTTRGNNNAGDITLIIGENLNLSGTNSGIFADTDLNSFGNGGKIFIDPPIFIIRDGAAVSVNSQGKGTGGDIEINANFLTLDNGKISAQTFSTTGGNITLRIGELLWLKNGSQISTTAGTANAGGDGGNIDIDSVFILSNFYDNNDITANAFTGNGGNIRITVQGILGLVITDGISNFSDITASSQFGLDGNIIINTAGIDPTRGLDKLTSQSVNPEIRQGCQARGGKTNAEFYNLGWEGLPETPDDFFSSNLAGTWTNWDKTGLEINLNFPTQIDNNLINKNITTYLILPCQRR